MPGRLIAPSFNPKVCPMVLRDLIVRALVCFIAFAPVCAWAQDDGARAYQLAPDGIQTITVHGIATRGNQSATPGSVVRGADVDVNVAVVQYTRVFSVADRTAAAFAVLPMGRVDASLRIPGTDFSTSSSGLGDAQIGGVIGLIGSPSLSAQDYARFKPRASVGLLGKLYFPTGEYDAAKAVNLGTNRYMIQLGVPISYAIGDSFLDPSLTTFELLPTVLFFGDNDDPFGAEKVKQDPLFGIEGHITHNFNRRFWASADLLYRQGGATTTDGADDNNRQRTLGLGATAGIVLSGSATLKLTYGESTYHNDDGVDGWLFRGVLIYVF